jgi:hypothetical protein
MQFLARWFSLFGLLLLSACSSVPTSTYAPKLGQMGKDVMWLPTRDELVTQMLTAAQVSPEDEVVDLGAGDGKIAIAAARQFGARAWGIEYNKDLAALAQRNAEKAGVAGRVRIVQGDIFKEDFSRASVVTLYLLEELNEQLRPTLLGMRPGTRVVSNTFGMGDWEPDQVSGLRAPGGRQHELVLLLGNQRPDFGGKGHEVGIAIDAGPKGPAVGIVVKLPDVDQLVQSPHIAREVTHQFGRVLGQHGPALVFVVRRVPTFSRRWRCRCAAHKWP